MENGNEKNYGEKNPWVAMAKIFGAPFSFYFYASQSIFFNILLIYYSNTIGPLVFILLEEKIKKTGKI